MGVTVKKPRRTQQVFGELDRLLASRGYEKQRAKGLFYWLWLLPNKLPLYCWNGRLGQNKIFIDATRADLRRVLASVTGIIPPSMGTTKNSRFDQFQFKRVKPHTGAFEYEGWKFQFLDERAANKFLDICEAYDRSGLEGAKEVATQFEQNAPKKTGNKTVTEVRVGQQDFKKKLVRYWKTCAVTGCSVVSLLRASHIKPWSMSDSEERLDPFNGLLLVPSLDALFDAGLITFDGDGSVIISSSLPEIDYEALGLGAQMRLRKFNTAHTPYLEFHRAQVFKP